MFKRRPELQFPFGAFVGAFIASCGYEWLPQLSGKPGGADQLSTTQSTQTTTTADHQCTARHVEISKYGLPQTNLVRFKSNYISSASLLNRSPSWTLEHLTRNNVQGPIERNGVSFLVDRDLEPQFRAHNDDYFKSGYSRMLTLYNYYLKHHITCCISGGHMVPAGNSRQSMEAMRDSFLLNSNIVPQDLDNNIFYWNRVERFARQLTESFDEVFVISGPLYLPRVPESQELGAIVVSPADDVTSAVSTNGSQSTVAQAAAQVRSSRTAANSSNNIREIRLIGKSEIAVPTHLFKAFLATRRPPQVTNSNKDDDHEASDSAKSIDDQQQLFYFASFVIPNEPISGETPVESFKVDWAELERLAGLRLFPDLPSPEISHVSANRTPSTAPAVNPNDLPTRADGNVDTNNVTAADIGSRLAKRFQHVHDLCATIGGCYLMDAQRHRIEQLTRSLRSARTKWYADRAMSEIRRASGAAVDGSDDATLVDADTVEAYRVKLNELAELAAAKQTVEAVE
jgi:DNA/RNA endonuclease G (NUC1)